MKKLVYIALALTTYYASADQTTLTPSSVCQHYLKAGKKYQEDKNFTKALASYYNVLRIDPQHFFAAFNAGTILYGQKKYADALQCFEQALTTGNSHAQCHYNCGICHVELSRFEQAETCFKKALALNPSYEKALRQLADVYKKSHNYTAAIETYQHLLKITPHSADMYQHMGQALSASEHLPEAVTCFEEGLQLQPHNVSLQFDLANTLNMLNRMPEALVLYQLMAEQHADVPELVYNYAYALKKVGRVEESIPLYTRAIELKPSYANAHFSLGLAHLTLGNFKEGWPEYEWRWSAYQESQKKFAQPVWDGSDLHGKRIFVYAEQGLGDTFQFIRYLKLLKERGATIIFQTQKVLARLLSLCPYIDELTVQGQKELPPFDTHIALMSLPLMFDTQIATVPHDIPYLNADENLVSFWHEQISADKNFKVGICWQGNASYRTQALRHAVSAKSISADTFAPLADIPGVSFYSLQKVNGEQQLTSLPQGFVVHSFNTDFDDSHGRFMDTAALIKNLDLVITVDTSISHLSAALGALVWVLLPNPADWRWMLDCNDTPWYPNMKLFRQQEMGDWHQTMLEVRAALEHHVHALSTQQ